MDAILPIELARGANRYTASGFGENAFRLRQQLDRTDNFRIAHIFAPSAAAFNGLDRVMSVSRVADSERACDGRRLLRFDLGTSGLDRRRNRRTSGSLRSEELYVLALDQSELDQFVERFFDLHNQRSAS